MKKLIYTLTAIATLAFAAGCAKEIGIDPVNGDLVDASFEVVLENTVPTKVDGVSDGANVDQLLVRAYDKDGKYLEGITFETEKLADLRYSVKGKLVRNYDYKVVFFAQKQNTYSFSGTNGNEVVFAYSGAANNNNLDAFYAVKDVKLNPDDVAPMSVSVTLKRPFAQVNVGSVKADYDAAKATGIIPADASSLTSVLELQGIPNTLNVLTGEVSGSTTTSFTAAARPSGTLTVAGKTDVEYIAMAYVLAGTGDGQLINKIVLTVNGVNDYTLTRNFLQVPYKQNYRTNLSGSLFTGDVTFDVVVGPGFENTTDKTIDAELPAPVVTPNTVITPNAAGKVESTVGTTIDFGVSVDKQQSVSYSSSDETVGTITNVGIFTPLKAGETDITISIAEKIVTKAEIDESKSSAAWVKTYHVIVAAAPVTSYAITKSAVSNGTLVVKIDDAEVTEAAEGATVTVDATPAEGYQLATLTYTPAEGEAVDIKEAKSFTMPAKAVEVAATFEVIPATVYTVTVGNLTGGTITATPASGEENAEITLTVTPAEGKQLKVGTLKYTPEGGEAVAIDETTKKFNLPAANVIVSAEFEDIPATLYTITITGSGLTSDKSSAAEGETVTLTIITPSANHRLKDLTVLDGIAQDVALSGTGNTRTFSMPASNVEAEASFEEFYSVTITQPTGGTISLKDGSDNAIALDNNTADIVVGEYVQLVATASTGYTFSSWSIKQGSSDVEEADGLFVMPAGNVSVTATFTEDTPTPSGYSITFSADSHGAFSEVKKNGSDATLTAGALEANEGDVLTFKFASNDADYAVNTVKVGETTLTANASNVYSYTVGTAASTIAGTTRAKEWKLVTDASTLSAGDKITFAVYGISVSSTSYYHTIGSFNSSYYNIVNAGESSFVSSGSKLSSLPTGTNTFTLGGNALDGWTIYDDSTNKYVTPPTSKENKCYNSDTAYNWSISISGSDAAISGPTISDKLYKLQWNANASSLRFSCYASTQKDIRIYRYE